MKVFTFAKAENMRFFLTTANLIYDQKCSSFSGHTNIFHDLKFLNLVQRLRHVHHSQVTPISYTFLEQIIDTAQLHWASYKPLWQFGEVPHLAAMLHFSTSRASTGFWQQCFFKRPTVSQRLCVVSLAHEQLRDTRGTLTFCPVVKPTYSSWHLHPVICTWDAVTICTPVTIFLSTWGVVVVYGDIIDLSIQSNADFH